MAPLGITGRSAYARGGGLDERSLKERAPARLVQNKLVRSNFLNSASQESARVEPRAWVGEQDRGKLGSGRARRQRGTSIVINALLSNSGAVYEAMMLT